MTRKKSAINQKFAFALSSAIERIALRNGRLLGSIEDEIAGQLEIKGGGPTVRYWKSGAVPRPPTLRRLTKVLFDYGGVSYDQAVELLQVAEWGGDPAFLQTLKQPSPGVQIEGIAKAQARTGDRPHAPELVGRDAYIEQIVNVLTNTTQLPVVGIDGLGGIGKTALAQTVAKICVDQNLFEHCVEVSAQRVSMPWGIEPDSGLTFTSLLDEIAKQLTLAPLDRLSPTEQFVRVRNELRERKVLLVIDNMETAGEPQEEIIRSTLPLLGVSRALVTSRTRFSANAFAIHLPGLDVEASYAFAQREGLRRDINDVAGITSDATMRIHTLAGGAPLAMQLVVGQMRHLPLSVVLDHLQNARPLQRNSSLDEYVGLYQNIYADTWQLLVGNERNLLVSMSLFTPGLGGTLPTIGQVSELDGMDLTRSIEALWRVSLLETVWRSSSAAEEIRYALHPLTQHFVNSDLIKNDFPGSTHD